MFVIDSVLDHTAAHGRVYHAVVLLLAFGLGFEFLGSVAFDIQLMPLITCL